MRMHGNESELPLSAGVQQCNRNKKIGKVA
jgi:hypothetical protein